MARFALKRTLSMGLVMLAVSVLVFILFAVVPGGDPAQRLAGPRADVAQIERVRADWGLDEPLPVRYVATMENVLTGDLASYTTGLDVDEEIRRGLPITISLAVGGAVMSLVFGVALGLVAALRAGRLADRLLAALALLGISTPVFWIGALAAHYLGFEAGLFPNGGYVPLTEDPLGWAHHLALPWTVLSLLFIGVYSRLLRGSVLEALG
ncbi:MAG TPA: ABC transporter permease, partial [Thermoleophilaceae bacterium]|nr:ABC transporter permease [Thermoleophilaceae bacterium]